MISVLIVEDDPMVAKINEHYLSQLDGFRCIGVAKNSHEAVDFLINYSVDLLLLDIYMPGRNGLELLSSIRKKNESVDIIIISAESGKESIRKALRFGVVDYLIKPFTFERFRDALLKYQKKISLLNAHSQLSQDELDQLLHPPVNKRKSTKPLPKGLTRETLQRVVHHIIQRKKEPFTTEALAKDVGISRISMRKYLSFLLDIGYLHLELEYKSNGRPAHLYTLKNLKALSPYLEAAD